MNTDAKVFWGLLVSSEFVELVMQPIGRRRHQTEAEDEPDRVGFWIRISLYSIAEINNSLFRESFPFQIQFVETEMVSVSSGSGKHSFFDLKPASSALPHMN